MARGLKVHSVCTFSVMVPEAGGDMVEADDGEGEGGGLLVVDGKRGKRKMAVGVPQVWGGPVEWVSCGA